MAEIKKWVVEYDHKDGRQGKVEATTEIGESGGFRYGNGKAGLLTIGKFEQCYDLRYINDDDLHMAMLRDYFGKGLTRATQV